jgi:TPR repeat protein
MNVLRYIALLITVMVLSFFGRGLYVRITDKDHVAYKTEAARRVLHDEGLHISETTIAAMLSIMSLDSNDPDSIDMHNYYKALIYAESGSDEAQYQLGLKYLDGVGTLVDREQAIHWMEEAAGQGHKMAQAFIDELKGSALGHIQNR